MKLKNKKTGEIVTAETCRCGGSGSIELVFAEENQPPCGYNSLAELCDEWEDYKEPKENWIIEPMNEDYIDDGKYNSPDELERYEELGLIFNTKEEAEKAVEKLKCFSNLKNHEFMFDGWYYGTDGNIVILANAHEFNDIEEQDLTKVFGEKLC